MALHQYQSGDRGVVARPTGQGRFQARIALRGGAILADEPAEAGGLDSGPTPYELLSAALAACTAMTMRLYADRKQWLLPGFEVEVAHSILPGVGEDAPRDLFTRRIVFDAPVEAEQEKRLLEIADRCPVHRTLMRGFQVVTEAVGPAAPPLEMVEPRAQHEQDMEQACAEDEDEQQMS
jgi:putative redox protein